MEKLPVSRILLNPPQYNTLGQEEPMISGLPDRYYLHGTRAGKGIVTDAKRTQIGTVYPEGNYWRDELTNRTWSNPIVAAHTYLLAKAPQQYIKKAASPQKETENGNLRRIRNLIASALLGSNTLTPQQSLEIKQAIRLTDKLLNEEEI